MRVGINAHLLAFTSNYRQAGLSRYIYEMAMQLPRVRPGVDFRAYVTRAPLPASFRNAAPPNLTFSPSLLPTVNAPTRIAWEQTALPLALAAQGVDLLFCPVNVRPLWSPCPVVLAIHDVVFLKFPSAHRPVKRAYLTAMTRWSARHADHIIAVSEATRRDVIELLGVAPNHVTAIHNGVGVQFAPLPDPVKDAFRLSKSLPGRLIFYVGTLEPRKNLATLISAFDALASDPAFRDVTLAIGGSKGWYYDEIFKAAHRLGLDAGGRVRFLGRVPDDELPLWYNIATVCAYPSLYEGFGLPPLEAMACATPVVVSNTSSLPEVVGDAGLQVDPLDTVAWASALRSLLSDPAMARLLGERGLDRSRGFSWERTARETAAVFDRVFERRARSADRHRTRVA